MTSKQLTDTFRFLFFFLTAYYVIVFVVLPFFVDPRVHQFENYHRLYNWDFRQHARDDFDGDGQEDLLTFTGCALLSSVGREDIPPEKQCTATGIASFVYPQQDGRIGQKYVQTDATDLDLSFFDNNSPISHSYVAKNSNENWKIFVNSDNGLDIYEIKDTGLLEKMENVPQSHTIDEFLYSISQFLTSRFFAILTQPLIVLTYLFVPIFAIIYICLQSDSDL